MITVAFSITDAIEAAANRIDVYRNKRFGEIGLTSAQARVLKALGSTRNGLSLSEVADRMPVDTLPSRLVSVLVDGGLVARQTVPDNRRMQCIRLTAKGRKLIPQIRRIDASINRWIARQMKPCGVRSVKAALAGIIQ